MKIKFNGDSISKNIWNGKYLRSFWCLKASVEQIFHRVVCRPEDIDMYFNGTLEGNCTFIWNLRSRI
jgi:hypothetical protein